MTGKVYKVVSRSEWEEAVANGVYRGAAVDHRDGYIHLSDASQVEETVAKHFRDQRDLLLITLAPSQLGDALRWEPSRGGALFPHLYGELDVAKAECVQPLTDLDDGTHRFPDGWR